MNAAPRSPTGIHIYIYIDLIYSNRVYTTEYKQSIKMSTREAAAQIGMSTSHVSLPFDTEHNTTEYRVVSNITVDNIIGIKSRLRPGSYSLRSIWTTCSNGKSSIAG